MTTVTPQAPLTVRCTRFIRAPRERVFEAWMNPDMRRQWWKHGQGLAACDIDARVGGRYRMKQIGCDSEELGAPPNFEWIMEGEFVEIDRPSRLVFTWNVNHTPRIVNNRVTIELHEEQGGTRVELTHEGSMSVEIQQGTNHGWTTLLDSMAEWLERA